MRCWAHKIHDHQLLTQLALSPLATPHYTILSTTTSPMRTVLVAGSAFALGVLLAPWFHAGTPPHSHQYRRAHLHLRPQQHRPSSVLIFASFLHLKPTTLGPTINDTLLHVRVDSVAKRVLSLSHLLVPSALFVVLCQRKVSPPLHPIHPAPSARLSGRLSACAATLQKLPSNFA
jgi:hypothetical protein